MTQPASSAAYRNLKNRYTLADIKARQEKRRAAVRNEMIFPTAYYVNG